jgi:hypothetical protein
VNETRTFQPQQGGFPFQRNCRFSIDDCRLTRRLSIDNRQSSTKAASEVDGNTKAGGLLGITHRSVLAPTWEQPFTCRPGCGGTACRTPEIVYFLRAASPYLVLRSQEWLCHWWHRHSCLEARSVLCQRRGCVFASSENVETRGYGKPYPCNQFHPAIACKGVRSYIIGRRVREISVPSIPHPPPASPRETSW